MLIVHHLENSRSQRVLWLLEELGAPYEVKRYERDPVTGLGPQALYDIHPLGKSPMIEDNGEVIAETGAIFEYILDTYDTRGGWRPVRGTPEARNLSYWLHYAEGSAMLPLLLKLIFSRLPERSPALMRPIVRRVSAKTEDSFIDPRIGEHVSYWEAHLTKSQWFSGAEFGAADIMMSFPLEAAGSRFPTDAFPKIAAFLEAIHARPAYQRALEAGGPYAYA